MSGRGRGRGALTRWEAKKPSGETSARVGSSAVGFPLSPKENWEDDEEAKQEPVATSRSNTHIRVTHIIDVEHFWAQIGKDYRVYKYIFLDNIHHKSPG